MSNIDLTIEEVADRRDLTYMKNFNGRAYALMDLDWIGYLTHLMKFLNFSIYRWK